MSSLRVDSDTHVEEVTLHQIFKIVFQKKGEAFVLPETLCVPFTVQRL